MSYGDEEIYGLSNSDDERDEIQSDSFIHEEDLIEQNLEVESDAVTLIPNAVNANNTATLNDFVRLGPYVWFILVAAKFITLTNLSSMVYMVYAGLNPTLIPCAGENTTDVCEQLAQFRNGSSECKPQVRYQFYSINVEFDLLCEDKARVKNSISWQMLGVLTGAFLFGNLSDNYGRKRVLIVSLLGVFIFSAITANVASFTQFLFTRILASFFTGGLSATQGVFLIENIPRRHRMWINTIITWSPNFVILPGIAYLCADWRKLALFTSGTALCGCFVLSFAFESPLWMIEKGRIAEARKAISRIRTINRDFSEADARHIQAILIQEEQNSSTSQNRTSKNYSLYHIVCTKKYLIWTTTLCFGVITASLVNYGLIFNIETLSGSIFLNNTLYGIIRWTVNSFTGVTDYFVPKFGRKTIHLLVISFIILAVASIIGIYYFDYDKAHSQYIRYITIAVTAVSSQISLTKMMTCSELYPTAIRNIAISTLSVCSRGGVTLAPQLFKLTEVSILLPYIVVAVVCLLDLIVFQRNVPETKNKVLDNHLPPEHERLFYRART